MAAHQHPRDWTLMTHLLAMACKTLDGVRRPRIDRLLGDTSIA